MGKQGDMTIRLVGLLLSLKLGNGIGDDVILITDAVQVWQNESHDTNTFDLLRLHTV